MDNAASASRGSALTRFWQLTAAVLVGLAVVGSGACFGSDDTPAPTPAARPPAASATATPAAMPPAASATATPAPTTAATATPAPTAIAMTGGETALPPEVRVLLDVGGADLLLGVVTVDAGVGADVVLVMPDSPAAGGGLADGDLITAIDAAPVGSAAVLRAAIEALAEGAAYTLTIDRGGVSQILDVERATADSGNAWRAEMLRSLALLLLQEVPGGPDVPPSLLGEMAEETADGLLVFAVFPGRRQTLGACVRATYSSRRPDAHLQRSPTSRR